MPTPTKPVPWENVAARIRGLTDWLVKERRIDAGLPGERRPLELAKDAFRSAERGSLVARVAGSIIVLQRYHAAGSLHKASARHKGLSTDEKELLYDNTLELEADADIRGLSDRIEQIRHLLSKIGARQERRIEFLLRGKRSERVESLQVANRVAFDALYEDLAVFDAAIEELHVSFGQFNHARTAAPLTLSGWLGLQKQIKGSLVAEGYPWPKESSRRSSGIRASRRDNG